MPQEKLFQYATEAKRFMNEVGEGMSDDESIMRAVVAYDMLERYGMLAAPSEDDVRLGMVSINRACAIAYIAQNFEDHPPSTPERAALFAHKIET